jgi:1-deoxy-D-xylulose-5-phosphate reductoisomerase
VQAFLDEKIGFLRMPEIIEKTMEKVNFVKKPDIDDLIQTNSETRRIAQLLTENKF